MKSLNMQEKIEIPEGVQCSVNNNIFTAKGKKGELTRKLGSTKVKIEINDSSVIVQASKATKREKRMIGTFVSHIKNIVKGVNEGYEYQLKVCSGHFPMNVSLSGDTLIVKNYVGEKVPRTLKLKPGVKAKVDGNIITVEGIDKELVSQTSADIETLTKRVGFDRRIFQDGIYIINKAGKELK